MKKEKKSFWKRLRTFAIASLVVVGIGAAASMLAFIPVFSIAATIAVSNIATMATFVGMAGTAIAGVTALTAGVVNGLRYIFSKKYRNQVRDKRTQRTKNNEQEHDREKENKKEKTNIFKRLWNKLFGKKKGKENSVTNDTPELAPAEEILEDNNPVEENVIDNTNTNTKTNADANLNRMDKGDSQVVEPTPVAKKSSKAAGMYDVLSDENKALYDTIVKKNKPAQMFDGLSRAEAVYLKETYNALITGCRAKVKSGETLTAEEEVNLVHAAALRTKITAYIKTKDSAELESLGNEEDKKKITDKVTSRIVK